MAIDESRNKNKHGFLTIDVVVPSYRVDLSYLSRILELHIPHETMVEWYIIIDNPEKTLADDFKKQWPKAHFIQNAQNLGASQSRNVGFDAGSSDWVIFLDDDLLTDPHLIDGYVEAIRSGHGNEAGFAGVTEFPKPTKPFPKAVLANGIIRMNYLAKQNVPLDWAVSANFCVHRSRIGPVRFKKDFPKNGGGEDVEFGVQFWKHTGQKFMPAPKALAIQPWWNNGTRSYRGYLRFYRWGSGDARILFMHSELNIRHLPNQVETIAFIFCYSCIMMLGLVPGNIKLVIRFVFVFIFFGVLCESIHQALNGNGFSIFLGAEVHFINCLYQLGQLFWILPHCPYHIMSSPPSWDHSNDIQRIIEFLNALFVTFVLIPQEKSRPDKEKEKYI